MANKVLVIDDSVSMRQMTGIMLTGAGYTVIDAPDGPTGFSLLDESVDLVIADYTMPGINGVELIERIRREGVNRSVPILMVTTETEASKKEEGRRAGVTGWITKPFDKDQLLGTVKKVLGTRSF